MLRVAYIREHREEVLKGLAIRNFKDAEAVIDELLQVDVDRRKMQTELDAAQAESNKMSKQIGELFKTGKQAEANEMRQAVAASKETIKNLADSLSSLENRQTEILYTIPNIPNPAVPAGNTDEDNEVIAEFGEIPNLYDNAQPHWELAKEYELIDFEMGVKISGAGFPLYTGQGARLQRALQNFFLDNSTGAGYREVQPPLVVNQDSGYGTGQLPDKEGQMYHATVDDLYLIPTSEVPITNIYRNTIVKESDFPIKNTAYSSCFRREAGSYGKDVRGLNRLHQFEKVEIVQIAHPEKSYEALDEMVAYVKTLLDQLELPYRVLRLCGGDLGFTSALTYDFEVYSAAQDKWLEVSSVSNFENFQANRLKCRFKDSDGKMQLAHTLNGSALAFPRVLAALLENNQTENGIKIPAALAKYTGFDWIKK